MRTRPLVLAATMMLVMTARTPRAQSNTTAAALRARGMELGYNLDHAEALATFRAAAAADPNDPSPHRSIAATMWISTLFRQGAVTAEDFLGQAGSTAIRRPSADNVDKSFQESLNRALSLSDARLRANPNDADAHYQSGAAYGFLASYTATMEGSMRRSLTPARRAYNAHARVLDLDPKRKDAGLIVGMYRYTVATLPFWSRLMANLAGFGGDKDRGLRLVEAAAAFPSDVQPNARFALIVIYNREARYDDALRVIGELQRQFPRNRLLWLEAGCTAIRAGRHGEAREALARGLAMLAGDRRPRAFGEEARWRYHYGVALAGLGDRAAAERELRTALTGESHDWVRGRAYLELGKLASDRQRAADELRHAVSLCEAGQDAKCAADARAALRKIR